MSVIERIYAYAEKLYENALANIEDTNLRLAQINAAAASGAAMFVFIDPATPDDLKSRAFRLATTLERLLSDIWREHLDEYGQRFLSGKGRATDQFDHDARSFMNGLRDAAREIQSSP